MTTQAVPGDIGNLVDIVADVDENVAIHHRERLVLHPRRIDHLDWSNKDPRKNNPDKRDQRQQMGSC